MMKKLITGEEIYHGDFGEFSIGVDKERERRRNRHISLLPDARFIMYIQ